MADPVGKTILQLELVDGAIDRTRSYLEIHVVGQTASQRVTLTDIAARGLSAKEVVQITNPEIVTDEDFIEFISGVDGKSAYDLAIDGGYIGTVAEWLASLNGTDGADGTNGVDGKSAFEVAKEDGFPGNITQWLASLKGTDGNNGFDGKSTYDLAVDDGFTGTIADFIAAQKGETGDQGEQGEIGPNGKSAYELAVDEGFVGDLPTFIASLEGDKGEEGERGIDGRSAYQVAVDEGFVGTAEEWLETLEGKSAYQVAVDDGFIGNEAAWLLTLKGAKGDTGDTSIIGQLMGSVSTVDDLPAVEDYNQADYFFIGTHVHMNINGEWVDMGDFEGPPGKDGTGITIIGELPSIGFLPAEGENLGDAWLIGKSMFVWNGARWQEQGQEGLVGPEGKEGKIGPEGKSSFDVIRTAYPEIDTMPKYVEYIRGIKGDKGDPAIAFVAIGTVLTEAELPETAEEGEGYLVGNNTDGFEFHVWVEGAWLNLGNNVGPQGPQGEDGPIGLQGPVGRAMTPKGELADIDDLPTADNIVGDYYSIDGRFHAWDGLVFIDLGTFKGEQGEQGEQGPVGQPVNALGELASEDDLPVGGTIGDGYEIGGYIYVYGTNGYVRMGQWRGVNGAAGTDGKSAFEIAKDGGYTGTIVQWLASLKGRDGVSFEFIGQFANSGNLPAGDQTGKSAVVMSAPPHLWLYANGAWFDAGPAGAKGETGPGGNPMLFKGNLAAVGNLPAVKEVADTYLIADTFYTWNGSAWMTFPSLRGPAGLSLIYIGDFANEAALPIGTVSQVASAANRVYIHDGEEWVDSGTVGVQGETGKSAYELAVDEGFGGDLTAWLASIKGEDGDTGKSLYQDAVDRGLFSGTFAEFLAAQKGASGPSAFESAVEEGALPPEATIADFIELIRGPQGDEGEQGATGSTGPAISIIGQLANEAALPATGIVGTGYAIPDPGTPGTFNCFIWLDETDTWFNLGHIVGAQGPKGDTGSRGLQGLRGEKGDTGNEGTLWLVFNRDPIAVDGRINDYFFNSLTQAFFRKTDQVTWAPLGFIGGGNLNAPTADGKKKLIQDGAWIDAPLLNTLPPVDDGFVYQLVNGAWVKFDIYTLKVVDAAVVGSNISVDWNNARQFRIQNTTAGAKTVNLTNIPAADRATTVVIKIYGKVASFLWTVPAGKPAIRWFDGTAPSFTNDTTTVVLNWDGQELVGSVPN